VVVTTSEQAYERARNIVQALLGSYEMRPVPRGPYTVDFADPRISPPRGAYSKTEELAALFRQGKPLGHSATCRCDKCDAFNRGVRP